MKMHMRALLLSVVASVLLSSGCATMWMKQAPNTPDPRPSKAMVAGWTVHFDDPNAEMNGGKSLVGAALDALQNSGLDDFGKKATEQLKLALALRGYDMTFDHERSKILDTVELQSSKGAAALTGMWSPCPRRAGARLSARRAGPPRTPGSPRA